MGIRRLRVGWALGLFGAACMAAGNGKHGGTSVANLPDGKVIANWCPPKNLSGLARWQEGSAEMQVAYCFIDSTDANGGTLFSRLDVRQEELNSKKVIWKIHDEENNSVRKVQMFRPGFFMQDVDGDGKRETFIGYYFPGDGLEPVEFKFLAHKDGKKYAIRGQLPRSEEDASQYKAVHDPAFIGAPARMRTVTDSLFIAFITALCSDPDLGMGVPVPARILPQ